VPAGRGGRDMVRADANPAELAARHEQEAARIAAELIEDLVRSIDDVAAQATALAGLKSVPAGIADIAGKLSTDAQAKADSIRQIVANLKR
jgi:hypothetical protein